MTNPSHRTPSDLGPNDLVWDHFSRAKDADIFERIDAAAAAGYAGIGMYLGTWFDLKDDPAEIDRLEAKLDETGIVVANIEALRGWAGEGGQVDPLCAQLEPLVWDIADRFGCRYLQAIGPYQGDIGDAAGAFAALCDRAADHDLLVGIEWLPFTNITTAAEAMEIVERADRDNGGLCVDSWHLFRSTANLDDIRVLPGEKVFAVQLNDGPLTPQDPNYFADCLANRLTPGAGEFDLVGLVQALDGIGSCAPLGLEVCSHTLWAQPAPVAAQLAADGLRGILALARSPYALDDPDPTTDPPPLEPQGHP